jgi:4-azaleucine resistance transporter AzlC
VPVPSQMARGLRDALPIVLAYFPIAMTFGVITTANGIAAPIAFLISAWVYSGGAQFMLVSLSLAGTPALTAVVTVLLVNLRHFLYGTTLGPAFSRWAEGMRWLAAFGLTDEVFALTASRVLERPPGPAYQLTFTFACYGSWLAGTAVGAGIGWAVPDAVAHVLSFALPALFLALLLIGQRNLPHLMAAVTGGAAAIAANLLHWGSVGVVVGAVVGASVGLLLAENGRGLSDADGVRAGL